MPARVTAVVLCGGTSARMGGGDKTALSLGDRTVLDTLLSGLPAHWDLVCVGEARPMCRAVTWTRETPGGGGPVAGIAAGLTYVDSPLVVVLAGDQPLAATAARHVAEALEGARADVDGVLATQADGRGQPLLAAYRTTALRGVVPGDPTGCGVHRTVDPLRLDRIEVPEHSTLDIDTPSDLSRAEQVGTGGRVEPDARGGA